MKVWVLLLWLLLLHPLNALDDCQEQGDLRLRGRNGQNLTAGHINICNGTHWRAVCNTNWNRMNAKVVCRQLGFPEGGEEYFHYGWDREGGLTNFKCSGNETKLFNCTYELDNNGCTFGGVACRTIVIETFTETVTRELTQTVIQREQCTEVVPSMTQQSPCTAIPPAATGNARETGKNQQQKDCTALAGGLGALAAFMALGLVGVVVVWVWSCQQRRVKSSAPNGIKASDTTAKMLLDNPTYSSTLTSQPHPTVQYSSLGPRGMPTDNTIEGTAPTYDIIKNDGPPAELMGEGNYQVVRGEREGETYDVPFQRTTATPSTEDYSVLQHQ